MALGKGLGALLGEEAAYTAKENSAKTLPITKIEARSDQPRKKFDEAALNELAESIKTHGILQPITVRRLSTGYYSIIAGERRWRAARLAGLREVPVNIIEADDKKAKELALIENLQREDLDDMEIACGFKSLMEEFGMTQEAVAEQMGISRSAVANTVRLLNLPEKLQNMIRSGELTAGHARAIMRIQDASQQQAAAEIIVKNQLSVRQAEQLCARLADERPKKDAPAVGITVNYLSDVEKALSGVLGHKVTIASGKKKGKIEIEYYGGDDLQALIDALSKIKL